MRTSAPYVLAFGVAAVATLQAYAAFGGEAWALALGWQGVACALGWALGWCAPDWPRSPQRELSGAAGVGLGLGAVLLFWVPTSGGTFARWEGVVAAIGGFALALRSQPSFLIFLTLHAALMLVALSLSPSGVMALGFVLAAVGLFGALQFSERAEVSESVRGGVAARQVAWAAAYTALAFGALTLSKPPARPITARDWWRWLVGHEPEVEGGSGGGETLGQAPLSGGSGEGGGGEVLGFAEDVRFGDGSRESGEDVILYVQVQRVGGVFDPLSLRPPYWTGGALSRYEDRRWRRAEGPEQHMQRAGGLSFELGRLGAQLRQRFIVAPAAERSLYALYPIERMDLEEAILDREGRFRRVTQPEGPSKYSVVSQVRKIRDSELVRDRISRTGDELVAVPWEVAEAPVFQEALAEFEGLRGLALIRGVERWLSRFSYDLTPDLPGDAEPTLAFLEHGRGYCQHFASAMVLLLRAQGIPARVGIGFRGGEWRAAGSYYMVRRRHAHAWVEVPYEGHGWVVFDPQGRPVPNTPPEDDPEDPGAGGPVRPPRDLSDVPPIDDNDDPGDAPDDEPTLPTLPVLDPEDEPTGGDDPVEGGGGQDPTDPGGEDPPPLDPVEGGEVPDRTPLVDDGSRPGVRPQPPTLPASRFERLWDEVERIPAKPPEPVTPTEGEESVGAEAVGAMVGAAESAPSLAWEAASFTGRALLRDAVWVVGALVAWTLGGWVWRRRGWFARGDAATEVEGEARALPAYLQPGTAAYGVVQVYLEAEAHLRGLGRARGAAEAARVFAGREESIAALTEVFVRARYGPGPLEEGAEARARGLLEALKGAEFAE